MDDGRNDWIGNVDRPNLLEEFPLGWKSDVAAEMLRRLDIPYVALNPGASYRGFHDSLVNYLGNRAPQMIVCLHEDHVVAVAHGYAKATDKPMGRVGRQHQEQARSARPAARRKVRGGFQNEPAATV